MSPASFEMRCHVFKSNIWRPIETCTIGGIPRNYEWNMDSLITSCPWFGFIMFHRTSSPTRNGDDPRVNETMNNHFFGVIWLHISSWIFLFAMVLPGTPTGQMTIIHKTAMFANWNHFPTEPNVNYRHGWSRRSNEPPWITHLSSCFWSIVEYIIAPIWGAKKLVITSNEGSSYT